MTDPNTTTPYNTEFLTAERLTSVTDEEAKRVLSYLNLPPVGALADDKPLSPDGAVAHELPEQIRTILAARRGKTGEFASLKDLVELPGFGPSAFDDISRQTSDLTRYGQKLRPVWGGPESEREFFALLESATRYIHISMYIVGGEAGLRMARILARKMREGVKVRVLFCASGFVVSGSPSGTGFVSPFSELRSYLMNDLYVRKAIVREMREAGVPFVNSSPVGRHWKRRDLRREGVKCRADYEAWARARGLNDKWLDEQELIDRECGLAFANVDHRKMIIVDGERAFIGSMNIADSYLYSNELSEDPKVNVRKWQWHDNAAILEGGSVVGLNRLFAERWMLSGGDIFDPDDSFYSPPPRRAGDAVVTCVTSIPGMMRLPRSKNLPRLVASIFGADLRPVPEGINPIRERVMHLPDLASNDFYSEHCYPSDSNLLDHWTGKASSVPDFTLVVPEIYDTLVLGFECDRMYPNMLAQGARLFGFKRAILHSKVAVVDGWYVSLGSYNLTLRSGRADLELQFFVQCREYGSAVRERIRGDLAECRPITPALVDKIRSRFSIPVFDALVRYILL